MATTADNFDDEIRFRSHRSLKRRLKKLAQHKGVRKYQALARSIVEEYVNKEEVCTGAKAA